MNTLISLIIELLGYIPLLFSFAAHELFAYKLFVFIPVTVMVFLFRLVMANVLYVKRHDKVDWGVWAVYLCLQLISYFIAISWIWLLTETIIILAMPIYVMIFDKTRTVKTIIYNNSIVYEDNSEKYSNNKNSDNNEFKEFVKRRETAILRRFTFSRSHLKFGLPVLCTKFVFRVSPMATEEQLAKAVSHLNRYYDDYNWFRQKATNGIKYEFSAEIKINRIQAINFDQELSDALDWCVVPVGAIDVSTKQAQKETPYVWIMQDPRKEGKSYPCLSKTKLFTPSVHAFVVGATGGGKSVLLNTIIGHWVNKAKKERQAELYLADAKKVEFKPYESLEEVQGVAYDLKEAVELTDDFVKEMHMRNDMMAKEGIKDIPLNGKIKLKRSININGTIVYGSDIIEFKTKDGKIHRDRALNLDGRDDIIEVNLPEEDNDDEEEKDNGFGW